MGVDLAMVKRHSDPCYAGVALLYYTIGRYSPFCSAYSPSDSLLTFSIFGYALRIYIGFRSVDTVQGRFTRLTSARFRVGYCPIRLCIPFAFRLAFAFCSVLCPLRS